jgi:hypothetical protein
MTVWLLAAVLVFATWQLGYWVAVWIRGDSEESDDQEEEK